MCDIRDLYSIPWYYINKDSTLEWREYMRKLKVYLDTSVVSYLHQEDAPEKMKDTLALWDAFRQGRYEVYLSDIVINEIGGCTQEKLSLLLDYLSRIEYHLIQTADRRGYSGFGGKVYSLRHTEAKEF